MGTKKKITVHKTACVDKGAKIGDGSVIWHFSHICAGAKLGKKCKIGQNVLVSPKVIVGNNVKIQNNVSLYEGAILEDNVFCGPSCVFTNVINPRSLYPRNSSKFYKKTHVKNGASIGANATIICGVTLGRHAFVGAGSVVTKDVPDYGLVYGNPAKLKGSMCACGSKLKFEGNKAKCPDCTKEFMKKGEKVAEL